MPLFAIMSTICAGFVGLVVDGGNAHARSRFDQNIVDSATVAAAYTIASGGTRTQATLIANNTAALNGCTSPCALATPIYYKADGVTQATTDAEVASVNVSISDAANKTFTKITSPGSTTMALNGSAGASVGHSVAAIPTCYYLCMLGSSGTTVNIGGTAKVTVTGTIATNSASTTAILANTSSTAIIIATTLVTRGTEALANCHGFVSSCTGTFVASSPALVDPFSAVAYPDVVAAGTCSGCSSFGGSPPAAVCGVATPCTLTPGIYQSITNSGTANIVLGSGNYVLTGGGITVSGTGSVTTAAGGAMAYLTCTGYAATTNDHPCASGLPAGSCGTGGVSLTGTGDMNITPQTATGMYQGLALFFDRNNPAPYCDGGTGSAGSIGTIYAPNSAFTFSGTGGGSASIVGKTIAMTGTSVVTINSGAIAPAPVNDGTAPPLVQLTK